MGRDAVLFQRLRIIIHIAKSVTYRRRDCLMPRDNICSIRSRRYLFQDFQQCEYGKIEALRIFNGNDQDNYLKRIQVELTI